MGAPKTVSAREEERQRILRLARCEVRFLRNREWIYSLREGFFGRSAPPFRKLGRALSWLEHNFGPAGALSDYGEEDGLPWPRSAEVYFSRNKLFVRQFECDQAAYHSGAKERFAALSQAVDELSGKLVCFPAEAAAALFLDWIPCSEKEPLAPSKKSVELRFRRLRPAALARIEREIHRGVVLKKWQSFGSEQD